MLAVIAMFSVPNGKDGRLLDWSAAANIPWGVLILFGGGIAIAKAFVATGLSGLLGEWLSALATLELILVILGICISITFLTEITSNTATTTLMLPVLAAAAFAADIPPELLMVPAAMECQLRIYVASRNCSQYDCVFYRPFSYQNDGARGICVELGRCCGHYYPLRVANLVECLNPEARSIDYEFRSS